MGIRFYCGVAERVWNHHPVEPGAYACVSPISGKSERTKKENWVTIPSGTEVIQDSGAFSDGPTSRLDFRAALERQIQHADKHNYADKLTHRASYDLLIDEKWTDGKRQKKRWSVNEAEDAVNITVAAAEFMAKNRKSERLILSAQGVEPKQYLSCVKRIVPLIESGDMLGLGGWCILGIYRSLMPTFENTVSLVVPYAAKKGIKKIHIWGVVYAEGIGKLLWLCKEHGIELSTDSVGPSVRPVWSKWGYADWTNPAYKRPTCQFLGIDRAKHVAATREWLSRLDDTFYCKEPSSIHIPVRSILGVTQLALF